METLPAGALAYLLASSGGLILVLSGVIWKGMKEKARAIEESAKAQTNALTRAMADNAARNEAAIKELGIKIEKSIDGTGLHTMQIIKLEARMLNCEDRFVNGKKEEIESRHALRADIIARIATLQMNGLERSKRLDRLEAKVT